MAAPPRLPLDEQLIRAREICADAHSLLNGAAASVARAQRVRGRSRSLPGERRAAPPDERLPGTGWFALVGTIEGRPVIATCRSGVLRCSPAWRSRAELVVALGEVFSLDGRAPVAADLRKSVPAAFLTLVRASDGPVRGELHLPPARVRVGAS